MKKGLVLSGGGGRGAYQAGVYKYITEMGFTPDVISGTSVGAINATAIGCGMDSEKIIQLWQQINYKKVMKYSLWRIFKNFVTRKFSPLADVTPLRNFLQEQLDFSILRTNKTQIHISAVNILSGELNFFTNEEISLSHVMASASIPMVFPWQEINGEYYWDGGIMANTPILPMIQNNVRDLIVVLLTPIGNLAMDLPRNRKEGIERLMELSLLASFQNFKLGIETKKEKSKENLKEWAKYAIDRVGGGGEFIIRIVSPKESLGMKSILNFDPAHSSELIEIGYNDAKNQLGSMMV